MKNRSGVKLLSVLVVIVLAAIFSVAPIKENMNLGLDLQGGASVTLQAIPDEGETLTKEDMNQLVDVLNNRVNELGVSEPIIQQEGEDRIIVELAGIDDPESAIELIGKTARLEFRAPDGTVLLTGAYLDDAYAQINSAAMPNKQNEVVLEFNSEGADIFYDITTKYNGQVISIYLDDQLVSDPVVSQPISGGVAAISGSFTTYEEAADTAALLRGGSLPVNLTVLSKSTVGPTLGADSLDMSLKAAMIGLLILFLFMLAYYRVPGAWACISLVVYVLIVLWVLNLINATQTLTSIAGFILAVGMAVDSNIIIFERIREELFHGKSLKAGIEAGFRRALWTILDSNITTLIAAVVLYYFGTGTIKGFALTLSIGLIVSMFTAITFTRCMLRWMSDVDFLSNRKLYGM